MMRNLILAILISSIFSVQLEAMTTTFLAMKPNLDYMNFALNKYLVWHEKHFHSNLDQMNKKTDGLIKLAINQIDHWLVANRKELNQFQVNFASIDKDKYQQTFRVFIHPELRSHSFIIKSRLPKDFTPWFIQWDDQGTICFIGPAPVSAEFTLRHLCKSETESTFEEKRTEVISYVQTPGWPNPFPSTDEWEIRTIEKGKITSIYYSSNSIHPSRIPRYLDTIISLHGLEPNLPIDKYSIDAAGNFSVYYP